MRFPMALALFALAADPVATLRSATPMEQPPPNVAGGGEVVLEARLTPAGVVSATTVLRATPPFTEMLQRAVKRWRFSEGPRERSVIVAGLMRPPTVVGPSLGEPPQDVAEASPGLPFPTAMPAPAHPVGAASRSRGLAGQVVLEVQVQGDGSAGALRVVLADPAFEDAALAAVRQWRFRPPQPDARAFVLIGFPEPVLGSSPPARSR